MDRKNVVVLGGGISGLTAAYTLCKKGFKVTLIEKNDFVGGLAATFSHNNYLLDYGPHNFHTHIPGVMSFVKDELKIPLNRMSVTSSKLFFMGKFINYPLKIGDAIRHLDWTISMRCFINYIASRIRMKFTFRNHERSFEDWVKNRFGTYIYDLYFGPYVKKVWGIDGSELDATVAEKRIPEPSLFSLIVRCLSGIKCGKRHSEDPESVESYYPPKGIGMIADKLAEMIVHNGGAIDLGCRLVSVAAGDDGGKKYVRYMAKGINKELKWDYLINTIPVNELCSAMAMPGVQKISKDIAMLPYRSIILLYMFLSVEKVFDAPWIYFNEKDNPELIFNRMYEVGNFSREMLHEKKAAICLEITCYKGDDLWMKNDKELYETCIKYLEKSNFLYKKDVKEIMTKRLEVAYPVFRKGYHAHLINVMKFLAETEDIFCIGRQGLFSYANVDHCIDMGLKIGDLFDSGASPMEFYNLYENYLF